MTGRRSILKATSPALLAAFIVSIVLRGVAGALASDSAQETAWTIVWELPGAVVTAWAGWLVCRRGAGGILRAGLGGVMAFFVDHPVGTSLVILITSLFNDSAPTLMAIGGVIVSFVIFAPFAFAAGIVGGMVANLRATGHAADT